MSTSSKLDSLAKVADEANAEGDALAHQFLEANKDPNDQTKPANDNALEAREQAIAGMLAELYKIFGQDPEPEVMFASQLQRVHPAARSDIVTALKAIPKPVPDTWEAAKAKATKRPEGQPLEATPLNQSPHTFGSSFGHKWAADATLRALRESNTTLHASHGAAERDRRGRINITLTRVKAEGGIAAAGADHYLARYKGKLHAQALPFDSAPTSLEKIRETIWQRTFQAAAAARIREQMVARIEMGGESPAGPDLPSRVRLEIWRLLAAATLDPPSGSTEVHIEISAASMQTVRDYIDSEVTKSGSDPAMQRTLQWWSAHIFQAEFHHAWPQWLGGAFDQTRIYIPRALHNFEGITVDGKLFPGGFHQVFNDLFRAEFAAEITAKTLAINDPDRWALYVMTNPEALAHVEALLVQAYKIVFSPFKAAGQQAIQRWVAECKSAYPQNPDL